MVNCNYRSKIHKTFYPSVNNSIPFGKKTQEDLIL